MFGELSFSLLQGPSFPILIFLPLDGGVLDCACVPLTPRSLGGGQSRAEGQGALEGSSNQLPVAMATGVTMAKGQGIGQGGVGPAL